MIELERLTVSEQPRGVPGARDRCRKCLPAETGALVVDGRVDLRRSFELGAELAGPRVEPAALPGWDRAVQRVAQQLVPEVIQAAQPRRVEDEVVDELLERLLERLRRHIHDAGEDLGDETAPDDGSGACGGLCLG